VYIGREGTRVFDGAVRSAHKHGLPHEVLDAEAARDRLPALELDPGMLVLHEELAGVLFPERAIEAHLGLAERHGAELHFDERVVAIEGLASSAPITVRTAGAAYTADRVVVAAGAWLPGLMPGLDLPLTVERAPLFWFEPVRSPELLGPDRLPVWLVETDYGTYYGFPTLPGQGAKLALLHGGVLTTPDDLDRDVHDDEEAVVRRFLEQYLPLANGRRLAAHVCMYTNTPDLDFVIDRHPADGRAVICSPCSGHGFKFSTVVGSIAADLATEGATEHEIGFLGMARFDPGAAQAEVSPGTSR
jgi:sarcosine oxidase